MKQLYRKTLTISLCVYSLLLSVAYSNPQAVKTTLTVGENFRIHPGNTSQTEVFITVHPGNPDIMFASANTINFQPFFVSEGVYATTNGGSSWFGSDTCTGAPITVHGGDPGITIDKDGTFILTRLGTAPFSGLYSHFSTDNGLTWSDQNVITTDDLERAAVATDGNPASNYYARTYAVWVKFVPPFPVFFTSTNDGAANWITPQQINNPVQRSAGGDVVVDDEGTVHVCWAGVTSVSPFTEIFVGYAASTDGGDNWSVTENAFAMNGIQGILEDKQNIRVNGLPRIAVDNSGGARDGWIYIVTSQKNRAPAGSDPDIILNRSTDGGATWSSAIRVNQDDLNNGKIQYFPAISVDDGGGVNVVYYDDRTTTADSSGVFLSRSTDGGDNWTEVEVTDHHFKPVPIGGLGQGYQGDNIDITFANGKLWPVWMDNSTGVYQLWTAPTELSSVGIEAETVSTFPQKIDLKQNYPNPFNPTTTITYQLKTSAFVEVAIYDLQGRKVRSLLKTQQSPGHRQVEWDGKDDRGIPAASGIYFYGLIVGDRKVFRKMSLVR